MITIVPAILTDDPKELKELLERCEGVVERVSIDIIDGIFAKDKTVTPEMLADIETNLKIDYQLMVDEPVKWIDRCVRGQADRIIGHVERMSNQIEFVGKVEEVGMDIGLALDLPTPVSSIDPTILTNLDVVLVMSVPAGAGGQKFNKEALNKIKELDEIRLNDGTPYKIQDDGGVTLTKIDEVNLYGADEVSIGRRLFDGDLASNIKKFQISAYKYIKND